MTDEQFQKLAALYGFAPSRALRELLEAAGQPERKPLTQKEVFEWMDRAPRGLATMSLDSIWLVVFRYAEMAHGIRRKT